MENEIKEKGLDLSDMSLSQMDVYWEKAKKIYYNSNKDL